MNKTPIFRLPSSRNLLITLFALAQCGCALYVGKESDEKNASITRVESSTPVKQWPVKDPYIVNYGGKIRVIPDERYEPRPSKK